MDLQKYVDGFGAMTCIVSVEKLENGKRCLNDANDIYRAGGDEFTIIVAGITEEELGKRVEAIRKASEKYDHVCFAIGQCYEECRFNVRQALRLADERMYEDKRKFYEAHPELKR